VASIDLQTVIAAPPAAVYWSLGDPALRPTIDPFVSEVETPLSELEPGGGFVGRSTVTGSDSAFECLVTAIDADRFLGLAFAYADGARMHEQWRLNATASGTLVHYRAELILPGGLFGKILDRVLVGGGFRTQREAMLKHLKAAIEHAWQSEPGSAIEDRSALHGSPSSPAREAD
jgi:hypothetical protein